MNAHLKPFDGQVVNKCMMSP